MHNKDYNSLFRDVPGLETQRLILRPFRYSDIDEYIRFFRTEEVQQHLGGVLIPKDEADAKRWIDNLNGRCLRSKLVFTWAVEFKQDKRIIGRCDLGGFVKKSMAEISYYLSSEMWHKGIMQEAMAAVLSFAFKDLKLHRVQALVLPDNTASARLLQNLGFTHEGLLRKYDYGKGFSDVQMFSILDEDYFKC
ncbi:MAG: GNAT family protein [Candidatus Cloacimonadota bacterium]